MRNSSPKFADDPFSPGYVSESAKEGVKKPTLIVRGEQSGRVLIDFAEIWHYRELVFLLSWRDIKLRYAQTILGFGWAIIQPLFSTGLFTIIFGKLAKVPTDGIPYPVFSFTALLPWLFLSNSLGRCSNSLAANAVLISKVYFPRMLLPVGSLFPGYVDFSIGLFIFVPLLSYYGVHPNFMEILVGLPVLTLIGSVLVFGVSLAFSALNVRYRDVGNLLPFLTQVLFFATPITYPLSLVPQKYHLLVKLNPMVGIIEGYRSVFLNRPWDLNALAWSAACAILCFWFGVYCFRKAEGTFADII